MSTMAINFYKYPNRDPKTNKLMPIGSEKYNQYVKKYGTPKITSPKTGRKIKINKTKYKNLIKEGYTENELLYGSLKQYPLLPREIVTQITKNINSPTKRLINKENLKETAEFPTVPTLPRELVDEVMKNTRTPIKRLINKQYLNKEEKTFREQIQKKIYHHVIKNEEYSTSDYSNLNTEEFKEDQWEQILKLSNDDIEFLNILIKNINKFQFVNEDYSYVAKIGGFILDEGKIIFTEI